MTRQILAFATVAALVSGCGESPDAPAGGDTAGSNEPCVETPGAGPTMSASRKLTEQELQDSIYNPSKVKERRMWADSWLYAEAPELEVEEWLTDIPETKGKYVMIEFWGTFCPPCRRSIPILNGFHKKYKDDMVIIMISHEPVETVKTFSENTKIDVYSAVDTQARTKNKLNVFGIPHTIIIEPQYGCVIWEGFPLLEGYELTEKIIDKILEVGRKAKVIE